MSSKYWVDGVCKSCGCLVIETGSLDLDYMNTCTNPKCDNFGWHHVYDVEFLEYYNHARVNWKNNIESTQHGENLIPNLGNSDDNLEWKR